MVHYSVLDLLKLFLSIANPKKCAPQKAATIHYNSIPVLLQKFTKSNVIIIPLHPQDAGCGIGGPMREIAKFSGAHVIGLNCCDYQLERARFHNQHSKMEDLCSLVKVSK